jgi:hypothetical protein
VRKRKPGTPLVFHSIVHEGLDPDVLSSALGIEQDRFEVVPADLRPAPHGVRGDSAATLVMSRYGDTMLLFDFEGSQVLRVHERGFSQEYERIRAAFSAFVPSAGYEVLPGRGAVREQLVAGPLLSDVTSGTRTQAVVEILSRLPALAEHYGLGACRSALTEALEDAEPALHADVTHERISQWLGQAQLVPAHSDLKPNNIILSEDGPVCIDFGAACLRPAWFDGVKLALRSGLIDEGRAAWGGPLDRALEGFLEKVVPGETPEDWRRLAVVGFALSSRIRRDSIADVLDTSGGWAARSS